MVVSHEGQFRAIHNRHTAICWLRGYFYLMVIRDFRTMFWTVPAVSVIAAALLAPPAGAVSTDSGLAGVSKSTASAVAGLGPVAARPGDPRLAPRSNGARGSLVQLAGTGGCIGDKSAKKAGCANARAMKGPGPFMGSRAIALSPDGKHVYVAASTSDAIAVFKRDPKRGTLSQASGVAGCVAANGAQGCGTAIGLDGPNSIAISSDGRFVYATSRDSNTVSAFARDASSGKLTQLAAPSGCISDAALAGCTTGIALSGPDVLVISGDSKNVYVGSFFGNAVAAFSRDGDSGVLTQLPGTDACIAEATASCAVGIALNSPEGLATTGANVYVASAVSNAVVVLQRNSSGGLSQSGDGSGCWTEVPLTGCTTGRKLAGANALALSPNLETLYATSLSSNSLTTFNRSSDGSLAQQDGIFGCIVNLGAANCRFGRQMSAPEGLAVSPDGRSVYVTAFTSGAIDVFDRGDATGFVNQKGSPDTCVSAPKRTDCSKARALRGASSIVVSSDGRYVYATAFKSNAVSVFRRLR